MRGYHLDCKSGMPELEGLYKFADRLAEWKINTLLIEYEDRFPYKFAPEITLPGSPTLEEWDNFLKHCRSMGMKIIPLVQTHGHLNYLLKHEKFASFREGENIDEICPTNPEAVSLIKTMLEEVLVLHEEDEFFHIGADETWNLATCSECQKRLENGETKLDVFCKQVGKMHKYLTERGKRVIMWCDMFWRSNTPEMVKRLPEDIILCEWIYTLPVRKGSPRMAWNGKLLYSQKYCENNPSNNTPGEDYIENAESKAQEFALKYLMPDAETGIGKLSAHAEYFMQEGYEVIGVGAARSGQCDWLFGQGSIIDRLNNIANWSDYGKNSNIKGVIISSWSRGSGSRPPYSPWESALDAIAATSQFLWTADTSIKEFAEIASGNFFKTDLGEELDKVYTQMGINRNVARNELLKIENKISHGRNHLTMLKLNCEFDIFRAEYAWSALLGIEKKLHGIRYGRLPLKGRVSIEKHLGQLDSLNKKCQEWRKRLREELGPYFRAEELQEFIDSRIENVEFRIENLNKHLKEAASQNE
jgi:hexosaminidase